MAREELTVQSIKTISEVQDDAAGFTATFTAAVADGHQFANDGYTSIRVKTTSAGVTVTVPHPATKDGLGVEDLTFTLGLNAEQELPFLGPGFNQTGTNKVYINYSAVTGVTVTAVSYRV